MRPPRVAPLEPASGPRHQVASSSAPAASLADGSAVATAAAAWMRFGFPFDFTVRARDATFALFPVAFAFRQRRRDVHASVQRRAGLPFHLQSPTQRARPQEIDASTAAGTNSAFVIFTNRGAALSMGGTGWTWANRLALWVAIA